MNEKLRGTAQSLIENFGPVIVFYGLNHFWGLKPAIAGSTFYSLIEIAWRIYRKHPINCLFKISAIMTLIFGFVDLYSHHSFLFNYKATITNIFTGIFFGSSLFSEKKVLLEF